MKISVIIPTRSRKAMLRQALDSVLSQEAHGCEMEIFVVDNGSDDGTLEMLAAEYPNAQVLTCMERGSSAARNTGMRAASGEWIAFLDDDDVWIPSKIARFLALAQDNPEATFLYSAATVCDFELRPLSSWPGPDASAKRLTYADFLRITITPSVVMLRREVIERVGEFDIALLRGQDIDYFCRILLAGFSCASTSEELTLYRMPKHPNATAMYRSYEFVAPLTERYLALNIPDRPDAADRRAILRHVHGWHASQLILCRASELKRGDRAAARRALALAFRISPLHALKGWLT